ncbi:hypothetical protein ACFLIM_12750 [Nonomuraea sp. M3C6]|uniref:Uncharacterized protein n=1 Tax=Nonomuraea marmarensis TaxID=3351344 RepID=A0ABW7ACL2_9ACTN
MNVISGADGGQTGITLFCYTLAVLLLALNIYPMKWHDMSDCAEIDGVAAGGFDRLVGRASSSAMPDKREP